MVQGRGWDRHKRPNEKRKKREDKHFLCLKCRRACTGNSVQQHVRACYRQRACQVCRGPFPCRTPGCTWNFPKMPVVPVELLPWLTRMPNSKGPRMTEIPLAVLKFLVRALENYRCFDPLSHGSCSVSST